MKIAVTHLTRMQRGYVCVAGVNVDTGEHIRPVLSNSRLRDTVCAGRSGPFDTADGQIPSASGQLLTDWRAASGCTSALG